MSRIVCVPAYSAYIGGVAGLLLILNNGAGDVGEGQILALRKGLAELRDEEIRPSASLGNNPKLDTTFGLHKCAVEDASKVNYQTRVRLVQGLVGKLTEFPLECISPAHMFVEHYFEVIMD